eukprot:COSAG06_NODE_62873_length_264_cov_0.454545_1_plen_51_part_10
MVRKTAAFFEPLLQFITPITINLPRQARDKYRINVQGKVVSAGRASSPGCK